jgi:spore coat protein CotF
MNDQYQQNLYGQTGQQGGQPLTFRGKGAAARFGAHEVLEVHEVLTDAINGINQFQLYRPHVSDQQLQQILDRQVNFMVQEYNGMVNMLNQRGAQEAIPYHAPNVSSPKYGLNNPSPESPNGDKHQMNDRDVASGMLCCAKSSANLKMKASLECADPEIRRAMTQGAINCSEMAYETWGYMNQKGYYQVPTLKETTTNTVLNTYQPSNSINNANTGRSTFLQSDNVKGYDYQ